MTGFNDGRHDPGYSDAIAAHDDGVRNFLGIHVIGVHGNAVFGAQFEDVSDFDAVHHFESGRAFGAGVFGFCVSQVEGFCDGEVGTGDDTGEVCILRIGADDGGANGGDIMVDEAGALDTDGTGEANGGTCDLQDGGFIGQFDGSGFGGSANFSFVGRVITSKQNGDRFSVGFVDEGFDEGLRAGFQQFADLFDAAGIGCGYECGNWCISYGLWQAGFASGFCAFLVGCVAAVRAVDNEVFAVAGGDHEFV